MRKRWLIAGISIAAVLLIDQILKFWVKTNMALHEETFDLGFFHILFIENKGMAFGTEFGGDSGKLALSLFRLVAIIIIGVYLYRLIKRKAHSGLILSIALIFAGAFGNIIDSVFYGQIFDLTCPCVNDDPMCLFQNPYCGGGEVAQLVPFGEGYSGVFYGKVVDMMQFTVDWPSWMPWVGGEEVFPFVFNVADSAITIGVFIIIFKSQVFFPKSEYSWNLLDWFRKKQGKTTDTEAHTQPTPEQSPQSKPKKED